MKQASLPAPVLPILENPHWRVNFRPVEYKILFENLSDIVPILERSKVSLRGWDFPYVSVDSKERICGKDFFGCWTDFMHAYEYWRFYQSGQFIHLNAVREWSDKGWRGKLSQDMGYRLGHITKTDLDRVRGYIDVTNLIYTVTEIMEFAARLTQAKVYRSDLSVSVEIKRIKDFALGADMSRVWRNFFPCSEEDISFSRIFKVEELVADSQGCSLKVIRHLLERFGWMSLPLEMIKKEQENLLRKNL